MNDFFKTKLTSSNSIEASLISIALYGQTDSHFPHPIHLSGFTSAIKPEVLIDSYVKVEIEGRQIDSVIPVNREYIHNGNEVWVMNKKNELEIRIVQIIFRDKSFVYISEGLNIDERIITSNIPAPVNGMLLRLDGSNEKMSSVKKANSQNL